MSILKFKRFYVYVYLDPRKPGNFNYSKYHFDYEPFYVGKGGGNKYRIRQHLIQYNLNKCTNKMKVNKILKIQKETDKNPIIIKYKENLTEIQSHNLEKLMIKTIGRHDLKLGPLTNLTNGGEGYTGRFGKLNGNYGNKWSQKQKNIAKNKMLGRYNGKNNPNAKKYIFFNKKTKKKFIVNGDFVNFCKQHKLKIYTMLSVLYKIKKKFFDWEVNYIKKGV